MLGVIVIAFLLFCIGGPLAIVALENWAEHRERMEAMRLAAMVETNQAKGQGE